MKKWFEDVKVSKKLNLGFLFTAFLGLIIGVVGIISMIGMISSQQKTYDESTMGIVYSSGAESSYKDLRTSIRNLYIYYNTDNQKYYDEISNEADMVQSQLESYSKIISDDQDQQNFDATQAIYEPYKNVVDDIVQAGKAGATKENILTLIEEGASVADEAASAFNNLAKYNETYAQESLATEKTAAWTAIIIMIVIVAMSIILAILLGRYISGLISRPLQMLAMVSEHLAIGDVDIYSLVTEEDKQVKYRKDEIGKVSLAFNKLIEETIALSKAAENVATGDLTTTVMVRSDKDVLGKALKALVETLHELLSSVATTAAQVGSGAEQVSDGAQALSSGTTEQAATIEELTSAVTNVSEQAVQNAASVKSAGEYVKQAGQGVSSSNEQMNKLNSAMREIGESSHEISKITKLVEDIAFQTNILALNAAVEAARAGNAGKGFAVVADEVRNLAAKSAEAAKQTADLIQKSVATVSEGEQLADKTVTLLITVEEKASMVERAIKEIEAASSAQASAIEQINQGLSQVSAVIQTNAATAEESSAASEELAAQAEVLQQEIRKFKLRKETDGRRMSEFNSAEPEGYSKGTYSSAVKTNGLAKY